MARLVRAVHSIRLVEISGQQHRSESNSPRHYSREHHGSGLHACDRPGVEEIRTPTIRKSSVSERKSFNACELGRELMGYAAADRKQARTRILLVSDGNFSRFSPAACLERRTLLFRLRRCTRPEWRL